MTNSEFVKAQMKLLEIGKLSDSFGLEGFIQFLADMPHQNEAVNSLGKLARATLEVKQIYSEVYKQVLKSHRMTFEQTPHPISHD